MMVASARPMPDGSIAMPTNLKGSSQSLTALIVPKSVSRPPLDGFNSVAIEDSSSRSSVWPERSRLLAI